MEGEEKWRQYLIHPRNILTHFPAHTIGEKELARVRVGATINLPDFSKAQFVRVFENDDDLIAIYERVAGTLFKAKVVLI